MSSRILLAVLLASLAATPAVLASGPGQAATVDSDADRAPGKAGSRAEAARETREALEAYRRVLQEELDRLGERLAALEEQVRKSIRGATPEIRRRLEQLREQHAAAQRRLHELGDEGAQLWEDLRARMNRVVDELRREQEKAPAPDRRS